MQTELLRLDRPLDAAAARRADVWQALAAALHVCDPAFCARPQPPATLAVGTDSLAALLRREGYFQTDPIGWPWPLPDLAAAVTSLRQARIPLPFAFVYDEVWLMFRRLGGLIGGILGPDYRMIPDCMAWHVDPARGDSGWAPHRDKGCCSLFPDGTPKILNLWLPLTDATPLNGCMYIVPADRDPTYNTAQESSLQFQLSDIRALPARAGSVLAWTQAVIHWGARTADRVAAPRISLGAEFQRADLPPFAAPLLDPTLPPPLAVRLEVIARSILRHAHHGQDEAAADLARELLG